MDDLPYLTKECGYIIELYFTSIFAHTMTWDYLKQ